MEVDVVSVDPCKKVVSANVPGVLSRCGVIGCRVAVNFVVTNITPVVVDFSSIVVSPVNVSSVFKVGVDLFCIIIEYSESVVYSILNVVRVLLSLCGVIELCRFVLSK